ncbi:MAG: M23 family metallopeptidase [Hyphomonadaceae bacterium]
MKTLAGVFVAMMLAACAAAEAPAAPAPPAVEPAPPVAPAPEASAIPPAPTTLSLSCAGAMTQGGVALCRTMPGAQLSVDGADAGGADAQGWAVIGFTREHGPEARVEASVQGAVVAQTYAIAPREFDIQRVDGLPPQTVTPTDPAVLERIRREAAIKRVGWDSYADIEGWLDGFILPIEGGRVSGRWGNQRILNGVPASPHFGYDIAAPAGTPIRAPAGGVVTLAQPDMHYEGGLVFIDHGQNLITMYLHMSRLDVAVGDRVEQGQVIGAVGSSGRATGPHLCWRMKWRERQLDPSVAVEGLAAARAQLIAAQ